MAQKDSAREAENHNSQPQPGGDNPLLNAFMARLAVRGVKGELIATNEGIEAMLAKSGPVGEQVLGRLRLMESRGWSYGPLSPVGDPYLSLNPNPLSRAGKFVALGGYNVSDLDGTIVRRVGYNSFTHLFGSGFMSHGNATPLTRITSTVAHEAGHYSGMPLDYTKLGELTAPQQKIVAMRLLETETNAVITQLHIADVNKAFHPDLEMFRPGLIDGTFGSRLRANWTNPGVPEMYKSLKLLTPQEANAHVNKYIADNYAGVIDKKGRIGAFDMDRVWGKYTGELPRDADILAKAEEFNAGRKPPALLGEIGESTGGRALGRGLQALGALGIAYQLTDVGRAFQDGTGSGVGRMGRIGVQWGGAEVGSMLGAELGTRMAIGFLGKGKLGLLTLPLCTIFGAAAGAIGADTLVGGRVDNFLKSTVDKFSGL